MSQKSTQAAKHGPNSDPLVHLVKEAEVFYDARGRKKKVMLPYRTYQKMMEWLEDQDDIRAMNEAETDEPSVPLREFKKKMMSKKKR